jgi:hypothetical protein
MIEDSMVNLQGVNSDLERRAAEKDEAIELLEEEI